jgi:DNA-binding transcriptional LysR family regulator
MDWNDLRYFLAIARAGTLVRAGKELGVEHTTVARRLGALEAALGCKLFARGPDGLTLTEAGKQTLPSAEAIAGHVDDILRRVTGGDAKIEGLVRLTIPDSVNSYIVQVLTRLRAQHPGLSFEVLTDNRALDLRRGEADLAVRFRDVDDPDLLVRKLGHAGWSVYAAPAYLARKGPLTAPDKLAGHDVIGFAPSLALVVGQRWIDDHAHGVTVVMRANNLQAAMDAAAAGAGIGLLPCFMADQTPALRRLTPRTIGAREISLVVHPDLAKVARVRATMDFLIDAFLRDAALWNGERPASGNAP